MTRIEKKYVYFSGNRNQVRFEKQGEFPVNKSVAVNLEKNRSDHSWSKANGPSAVHIDEKERIWRWQPPYPGGWQGKKEKGYWYCILRTPAYWQESKILRKKTIFGEITPNFQVTENWKELATA